MSRFRYTETVTVARPSGTGRDMHGDPTPAPEHPVDGVVIYDARGSEMSTGDNVEADYVLLGPYDADLDELDVLYRHDPDGVPDRKRPLRVDGPVQRWKNPHTGDKPGCQAFLTYRAGGQR